MVCHICILSTYIFFLFFVQWTRIGYRNLTSNSFDTINIVLDETVFEPTTFQSSVEFATTDFFPQHSFSNVLHFDCYDLFNFSQMFFICDHIKDASHIQVCYNSDTLFHLFIKSKVQLNENEINICEWFRILIIRLLWSPLKQFESISIQWERWFWIGPQKLQLLSKLTRLVLSRTHDNCIKLNLLWMELLIAIWLVLMNDI